MSTFFPEPGSFLTERFSQRVESHAPPLPNPLPRGAHEGRGSYMVTFHPGCTHAESKAGETSVPALPLKGRELVYGVALFYFL
jgi:hypothetical protein